MFIIAGGAMSWVSKLQTIVALSTTEVEYMIATQGCKDAIWMKKLMEELGHKQEKIPLYCDSQSALHIARNPTFHSRTKHIDVQYHFVREVVEDGSVDFQKVHTKENSADALTKPVNTDKVHMVQILLWPSRNISSMKMASIERVEESQMIKCEDLIKSSKSSSGRM